MSERAGDLRHRANHLWRQTVGQLEDIKAVLVRSRRRFDSDIQRLRVKRDRLLKRLGEQTEKLARSGDVRVPPVVRRTVDKLNDVIDNLVSRERGARPGAAKRKAARQGGAPRKKTRSGAKKTAAAH